MKFVSLFLLAILAIGALSDTITTTKMKMEMKPVAMPAQPQTEMHSEMDSEAPHTRNRRWGYYGGYGGYGRMGYGGYGMRGYGYGYPMWG
ncbi:FIP (Fungus-Induced Protein) Related [Caenorhabditis elegans]|uniref:FIP (Fungus-Induced Protein) Related n=1 Tax=Caenorhabditis elegans TaxID=6239 RepID=G8JZP2_CAEEL|nr:FIP (Fungus-Induced Protein) Related [Caenorhabditis elegans]CCE72078.1 FIP (Fungus-Induced Protein) Related [Caenorhabditis elegans]|eukprot:NP_001252301.1 Uncharacterized protein CELE_C37A5.5 [Caenorhabditis elegans]